MGITRPTSSLAKQVSRATSQKERDYGPIDNCMPFILLDLCILISLIMTDLVVWLILGEIKTYNFWNKYVTDEE